MLSFSNIKIARKLPVLVIFLAAVSVAGIGVSNYYTAASELEVAAERQLVALAHSRNQSLKAYLGGIREDLKIMGSNETIKTAMRQFTGAYAEVEAAEGSALTALMRLIGIWNTSTPARFPSGP